MALCAAEWVAAGGPVAGPGEACVDDASDDGTDDAGARGATTEPMTRAPDLAFNQDERGPSDPSLRVHLAALDQLDPDERASIRTLIEGALLRHQARRLSAS